MSLLSKQIANLFNGVSQQTAAARLPSQCEVQENAYSDLVNGLHKRFPSEHVAQISSGSLEGSLFHTIARDQNEQYQVVVSDGDLAVYDLKTGQARTVSFPDGKGYLTGVQRDTARALTVEDYTFIVNRGVRPALSVTPYMTTDQVSVALKFGDGSLGDSTVQPKPTAARFGYLCKGNFSSGANPLGWLRQTGYATREAALQGWKDMMHSMGYDVPSFEDKPVIQEVSHQPDYRGSLTLSSPDYGKGIQIKNETAISVRDSSGLSFNPDLRIEYSRTDFSGGGTLEQLRADVGYPATPYKVPGVAYQEHAFPVFDGQLFVQCNGSVYSIGQQPGWSAEKYLAFFKSAIQAGHPELTVTVTNGWQLNVVAPQGTQLFVSAWDSNHHGYVQCVYSDLPIQEAVFVVIKNGVAEQTYTLSINGKQYSFTTGASDAPETYKIDHIANQLAASINGTPGDGFQAAVYGNFIKVIRPDKVVMTFASHDTWNDQAMYAMKNRVQAFEDLPVKFIPGHPIEVVGSTGVGGFYVHYTVKNATPMKSYGLQRQVTDTRLLGLIVPAGDTWNSVEGEETGLWEECAKPGVADVLVPFSMPHVLTSNADGSFTFKQVDWFKRSCGNEDSVPYPSFVNKEIVDLFFHRNRLGFLTQETVVFSRASQFFNFWSQTAKEVLDSDPIDIQVNHTKVATLRSTAVFNNQMLVFSDNTQFVVSAQQLLTPKTISVHASTEFEYSYKAKPVTVGNTVFFLSEREDWSQAWEYYVQNATTFAYTANALTAHVPRYVPKDVFKLTSSTTLDCVVALSDEAQDTVWVYKYAWGEGNQGKVQQSWSKWRFEGAKVLHAEFVQTKLVVVLVRDGKSFIETVSFQSKREDAGLGWLVHLDRKVKLQGVYASGQTTYTLPYGFSAGLRLVQASTGDQMVYTHAGDKVVTQGNTGAVYCGFGYQMTYQFSPVYMKDKENTPILGSLLTLKTWALQVEDTVDFRLEVTPDKRKTWTHQYSTKKLNVSALVGAWEPKSELYRASVMGDGPTTKIAVVNDSHFPVFLQSAIWEGDYVLRSRRV